jgi:sugar phosphate isomerase/epimerase
MKYGYCTGIDIERIRLIAEAGFDYVELPLSGIAVYEDVNALKKMLREIGIPVLACNLFFPSALKIVGPERDAAGIDAYLARMLPLSAELGVRTLVFGNGGLRRVPDGQNRETIRQQLRETVEQMNKYAAANDIRIGVEPLNTGETNIINSFGEAAALTEGLSHVAAIVDSYHVLMEGQDYTDVTENPTRLFHLHTAYSKKRFIPGLDDDRAEYAPFVQAVRRVGYDDKISVEGGLRGVLPVAEEISASLQAIKAII